LVTITSLSQYTESLAYIIASPSGVLTGVEALTLRGSHTGASPYPQGFSQGWKPSPSGVLTGVEALTLRGSHRGGNYKDKLKMFTSMMCFNVMNNLHVLFPIDISIPIIS